jgi:RHS repeat-associated protein
MEYFPFGTYKETVDYDSNFPDVFYTFTGQEDDDDLGFYNYVARLYDPVLGRFISPDIIVQNIEYPQTPNRYSYATNNPLRYVDPTGNQYESYDTNLWLSSIYGPLGSFGSSSYLNSNFGSPWKLDINIPNFNISSVSNIGLSSNINLNFSNTNFSNTYNRGALEIGSFGAQYVANNPSSLKETINSLADKFQSWWKDPLGTKARGDRRDYGYGDINLTSIGLFHIFGGTISVQITPEGYVYFCPGVAVGTKGTNLSGTMSNYDPSPGIILAGQVNLGLVGQLGYSFEGKSFFGELGGTLQTGFSVTCMYCLGPFGPFDAGRK